MQLYHAFNFRDPQSNVRAANVELQTNLDIARQDLREAPHGARQIAQFTLGIGTLGTSFVQLPAGIGELGDLHQEIGTADTIGAVVDGTITHFKQSFGSGMES